MRTAFADGENPLSREEQRVWDRFQFEEIVAPYVGDTALSEARVLDERILGDDGLSPA